MPYDYFTFMNFSVYTITLVLTYSTGHVIRIYTFLIICQVPDIHSDGNVLTISQFIYAIHVIIIMVLLQVAFCYRNAII